MATGEKKPLSRAAAMQFSIGTPLPSLAMVYGLSGTGRVANGQYQERQRGDGSYYFQKHSRNAFIYSLANYSWCVGPVLDSDEVVWAEKTIEEERLTVIKSDRWQVNHAVASGKAEISIQRPYVNVVGGTGLRPADLNGLSDPYVVVEFPGNEHLNFKTQIIKKTLNPSWQCMREIVGVEVGDQIIFKAFDWDISDEDDPIGEVNMCVNPKGFKGMAQLTLRGRKAGELNLEIFVPQSTAKPDKGDSKKSVGPPPLPKSIPKLVVELETGGEQAARAAGALDAIAISDDARSEILAAGAVRPLVTLLVADSADGRAKAAAALMNLAISEVCRRVIITADAVPALLDLLFDVALRVQDEVAGALIRLSTVSQVRTEIMDSGATPQLVRMLSSGSAKGPTRAAALLAILAEWPETSLTMIQHGALPPLVSLLSSGSVEAKAQAAYALARIGNTNIFRKAIIDEQVLGPLVSLLSSQFPEARAWAANTIAALAVVDEHNKLGSVDTKIFVTAGAVPPLVKLLSDYHAICNEKAARALCNVAANPTNILAMLDVGIVSPLLVLFLHGYSNKTREAAADTLRLLARSSNETRYLIESGIPRDRNRESLLAQIRGVPETESSANLPPMRRSSSQGFLVSPSNSPTNVASTMHLDARSALGSPTQAGMRRVRSQTSMSSHPSSPQKQDWGTDLRFVGSGMMVAANQSVKKAGFHNSF